MNDRSTMRIAIVAVAGALLLGVGLGWEAVSQAGWLGLLTIPDIIYAEILAITTDQAFQNLDYMGPGWSVPKVLVGIGRFLLPAAVIFAAYQLAKVHIKAWRATLAASRGSAQLIVAGRSAAEAFVENAAPECRAIAILPEGFKGAVRSTIEGRHVTLVRSEGDVEVWDKINLAQASRVVLAGEQSENLADLAKIVSLLEPGTGADARPSSGPLTIHVALSDEFALRAMLHSEEALKPHSGCEVRPYSPGQLAATHVFSAHDFHHFARGRHQTRLHAVFVGFGAFNAAMFEHFLCMAPAVEFEKPRVSLFVSAPKSLQIRIEGESPEIAQCADVDYRQWPAESGGLTRADLETLEEQDAVTAVFFDLATSELNILQAVRLRQLAAEAGSLHAPIFAYCSARDHLLGLTRLDQAPKELQVLAIGGNNQICRSDILDGTREVWASRIHEHYRELALQEGADPTEPRFGPWAELPESYRAANRRAAAHVEVKLESARHLLSEHGVDPGPNPIGQLSDSEVLTMAAVEHDSWCMERRLNGWRLGSRDDARKTHPDLIPFDELSDVAKQKDIDQIIWISSQLER